MYSKFPFLENIPRQRSFGCLSLKIGCIFSALLNILYSLLALSQCLATMMTMASDVNPDHFEGIVKYIFVGTVTAVHGVTFSLSAVMLLGVLRYKMNLMKPWVIWTSILLISNMFLFVMRTITNVIMVFDDNTLIVYVFEFLTILLQFFMLTLVASYYRELEEENETKRLKTIDNETWYTDG